MARLARRDPSTAKAASDGTAGAPSSHSFDRAESTRRTVADSAKGRSHVDEMRTGATRAGLRHRALVVVVDGGDAGWLRGR
jgi:hypothetical protein